MKSWAERLRTAVMTCSGIVVALTPPAMWMAGSPNVLGLIIGTGFTAAMIFCLLAFYDDNHTEERSEPVEREMTQVTFDEFIKTMHRLYPLTFHHGRRNDSVFAREMARLKRLLKN